MKKLASISISLFLILIFVGCSAVKETELLGVWYAELYKSSWLLSFNEDGTAYLAVKHDYEPVSLIEKEYTFSLSGDQLSLDAINPTKGAYNNITADVKLYANSMTLTNIKLNGVDNGMLTFEKLDSSYGSAFYDYLDGNKSQFEDYDS